MIHPRLPSRGRRRHGGSETEAPLDAVPHVMEGVLYARSDVAHTDSSSVVVDCGICQAHFASEQTDLTVSGWGTAVLSHFRSV